MKFEFMVQSLYDSLEKLLSDTTGVIKAAEERKINDGRIVQAIEGLSQELKKQQERLKNIIESNVDQYNVINFLNKALTLEYNSIFEYQTYVQAVDDQMLKDKLSHFGLMEMEHARILSEKIKQLGGNPIFNPPEFRKRRNLSIEGMLQEHKAGEVKAVALFDEGLKNINDPELNWFIGKLRLDELEHLKELEDLLKGYKDLKKIVNVSSAVKWHDDYAGDDKDRPWIEG